MFDIIKLCDSNIVFVHGVINKIEKKYKQPYLGFYPLGHYLAEYSNIPNLSILDANMIKEAKRRLEINKLYEYQYWLLTR